MLKQELRVSIRKNQERCRQNYWTTTIKVDTSNLTVESLYGQGTNLFERKRPWPWKCRKKQILLIFFSIRRRRRRRRPIIRKTEERRDITTQNLWLVRCRKKAFPTLAAACDRQDSGAERSGEYAKGLAKAVKKDEGTKKRFAKVYLRRVSVRIMSH